MIRLLMDLRTVFASYEGDSGMDDFNAVVAYMKLTLLELGRQYGVLFEIDLVRLRSQRSGEKPRAIALRVVINSDSQVWR